VGKERGAGDDVLHASISSSSESSIAAAGSAARLDLRKPCLGCRVLGLFPMFGGWGLDWRAESSVGEVGIAKRRRRVVVWALGF
jgi:hypothetical protein